MDGFTAGNLLTALQKLMEGWRNKQPLTAILPGLLGRYAIFHGVDQGGHRDVEFPHAGGSHLFALGSGGGVLKNHAFLDVALHLPKIAGMRFVNVNDVERDTLAVLLVELVERGNLPAKRRSSIAAKNQYDRLFATKGRE